MEQKAKDFGKIAKNIDKYRDNIVCITRDYEYKRYTMLRDMLFEMSKEEEPVLQDIKQCIVAVLKEQKECDIIKVSELETYVENSRVKTQSEIETEAATRLMTQK